MSKQNIHIRVDSSVYLALKSKDVNISGTVNDLLKSFIDQENIVDDESEIVENISNIKSQINKLNDELKSEIVKLQILEERKRKEEKDRELLQRQFVETMRHNNPLKEVLK